MLSKYNEIVFFFFFFFFFSFQKKAAKVKFGLLSRRIEKFFNIFISVTSAQKLLEKGNSILENCTAKDAHFKGDWNRYLPR